MNLPLIYLYIMVTITFTQISNILVFLSYSNSPRMPHFLSYLTLLVGLDDTAYHIPLYICYIIIYIIMLYSSL